VFFLAGNSKLQMEHGKIKTEAIILEFKLGFLSNEIAAKLCG
jgi:hypothetical protein